MRAVLSLNCSQCRKPFKRMKAEVEYRRRHGMERTFCSQRCFGRARRTSPAAKKARKWAYDIVRRDEQGDRIRAEKAAYYQRTRDPVKEKRKRQARAEEHAAYIRRYMSDPVKKAAKVAYDTDRRAAEYGEFAEAFKIYVQLCKAIRERAPDKYERLRARGYYERREIKCEPSRSQLRAK